MEDFKGFAIGIAGALLAYLNPLQGDFYALLLIFLLNFLTGLLSSFCVYKEKWKFSKAWKCIKESAVFFVLIGSIFFIGEKKGNAEGAMQCVTFVTYSVVYFYSVNILRNLKLLFPKNSAISFLYDIISIEFSKKIPGLKNYLQKNENESK